MKKSKKIKLPALISSDSLDLKIIEIKYAPIINTAIKESHINLKQWLPWAKTIPTLHDTEVFCLLQYEKFLKNQDLTMCIFNNSNDFLGCAGLHNFKKNPNFSYSFELGYWGNIKHSGKGHITSAVNVLLRYAFENFNVHSIYLTTDNKNVKSWKLAEKCGFHLKEEIFNDNRYTFHSGKRCTRFYIKEVNL